MNNGFPLYMKKMGVLEAKIDICYKKTDLVSAKQQKTLMMKQKFLSKIQHMKINGKKLQLHKKIEEWIRDNIDKFYEM